MKHAVHNFSSYHLHEGEYKALLYGLDYRIPSKTVMSLIRNLKSFIKGIIYLVRSQTFLKN